MGADRPGVRSHLESLDSRMGNMEGTLNMLVDEIRTDRGERRQESQLQTAAIGKLRDDHGAKIDDLVAWRNRLIGAWGVLSAFAVYVWKHKTGGQS